MNQFEPIYLILTKINKKSIRFGSILNNLVRTDFNTAIFRKNKNKKFTSLLYFVHLDIVKFWYIIINRLVFPQLFDHGILLNHTSRFHLQLIEALFVDYSRREFSFFLPSFLLIPKKIVILFPEIIKYIFLIKSYKTL